MRVAIAFALVVVAGCRGGSVEGPSAGGGGLRPATLVYEGRHEGDHEPWSYRETMAITAAERGGRRVWRRTRTYSDVVMAMMIDLDRATLAPVHSELTWNGSTVRLDFAPGQTTAVIDHQGAHRETVHHHTEPVVLSDVLDLHIASLPLAAGFTARIELLDMWLLDEPVRYVTRPFTIRVTGETVIDVPAGALPALVVAIDPADGDERLRVTYHVARGAPHYAVRMQSVVNPATVGEEKRSVGTDQLVSMTLQDGRQ